MLLYIVDNTGRHDIDSGREGLINDLGFLSYYHLHDFLKLIGAVAAVDEPSTRYIVRSFG